MDPQITGQILRNERAYLCLTSRATVLREGLVRYDDDLLRDMYDHNFFAAAGEVTEADYRQMLAYKQARGDRHLKISCDAPSPYLSATDLEAGTLLTMLKQDLSYPEKCALPLTFRHLKAQDIRQDLIAMEVKHYADSYGMGFTLRKCDRIYGMAAEQGNGLDFFAAYLGEEMAASCSVFLSDGVAGLDDLLTDADHRHRGIATALMAHVHRHCGCPLFLHADAEDTPKDMYSAMGYVTVKTDYEYLRVDKD